MAPAPQRHPGPRRPAPPRGVEALAAVGLRPGAARGDEAGAGEGAGGQGAAAGGHGGDGPRVAGGKDGKTACESCWRFDNNL